MSFANAIMTLMQPEVFLAMMVRPKIAMRKYSGELNISATLEREGAIISSMMALKRPPTTEANEATPKASKPLPCLVSS